MVFKYSAKYNVTRKKLTYFISQIKYNTPILPEK